MTESTEQTRAEKLAQAQQHRDDFADKLIKIAVAIKTGEDIACLVASTTRAPEGLAFSWSSFYGSTHDSVALATLRGAVAHGASGLESAISASFSIAPPEFEILPIEAPPSGNDGAP